MDNSTSMSTYNPHFGKPGRLMLYALKMIPYSLSKRQAWSASFACLQTSQA
jgi:hypothetical protein